MSTAAYATYVFHPPIITLVALALSGIEPRCGAPHGDKQSGYGTRCHRTAARSRPGQGKACPRSVPGVCGDSAIVDLGLSEHLVVFLEGSDRKGS